MRRLNVRFSQIEECIQKALFAVDALPRNPPLQPGELLLLQLVKEDASRLGKLDARVEFALVFDHAEADPTGERSRAHWPDAGKTWRHILVCRDTVPAIPFSLSNLDLSSDYSGQGQCLYVSESDASIIRGYFDSIPNPENLHVVAGPRQLLQALRNYDTVVRLSPPRVAEVKRHERRLSSPWLSDTLKLYYHHRCQICVHDFTPRYGVPYADTRFLVKLSEGGEPVSANTLVICPNHNAIIGAAEARFDHHLLEFEYVNGLREPLLLKDHLLG